MATPKTLFQDISKGKFKPAYYFFGSEDYRIAEAVKFVTHQFLPDLQRKVNYLKFNAKKTKVPELMAQLSNFPMLGEKQVFVITDFQNYKPTEIKNILSLLKPPDPNRIIIFSSPSVKAPKKNSSFFTLISKSTEPVEFKKLTYQDSIRQIKFKLQKEELTITDDALKLLAELIAGNRGALETETNKLINYKEKGETIEIKDLELIATGYEIFNMFELADIIISGKANMVLKMIHSLLAEGKSASFLTTLLQQHFTSLYLVKNGKKPLGRRDYLLYKFKFQAGNYDNKRLEKAIITIAEADAQLRQTGIKPETTLEILALQLTQKN